MCHPKVVKKKLNRFNLIWKRCTELSQLKPFTVNIMGQKSTYLCFALPPKEWLTLQLALHELPLHLVTYDQDTIEISRFIMPSGHFVPFTNTDLKGAVASLEQIPCPQL